MNCPECGMNCRFGEAVMVWFHCGSQYDAERGEIKWQSPACQRICELQDVMRALMDEAEKTAQLLYVAVDANVDLEGFDANEHVQIKSVRAAILAAKQRLEEPK